MNFKIVRQDRDPSTAVLEKDVATTDLDSGLFCAIDANGLAVKADATSTEIAYVYDVISETEVLVAKGNNLVLEGTADAPFAKTNRNTEVDIAIDGSGNQLIDLGASTTDVFKVISSTDAGKVGETTVRVVINKPIAL